MGWPFSSGGAIGGVLCSLVLAGPSVSTNDSIRLRSFAGLNYHDPAIVLRGLRRAESDPRFSTLPDDVRQLRKQSQKTWREGRVGALFAYGMGQRVLGLDVQIALVEDEDYDFVTCWQQNDEVFYCPVQEKELPPSHLNDGATLSETLALLARSTPPSDTVALVYLNRGLQLDFSDVVIPAMGFRELWFIGAVSPDQDNWVLFGDALTSLRRFDFEYPA